tara:strand:- start:2275 stop:2892 length:618 start_codon:yes stop_codon:yes gene_type:complete
MFNIQKIKDNVKSMGINVYCKNYVSSTNDFVNYKYVRDQVPIVVLTNNQRRPRGKRGALWINYNLHSFSFTLCLKLDKETIRNDYLSQVVGMSIIEIFQKYNLDGLKLKHPNDILKNGKKVGGILIENIIFDSENIYSAVGVGLNISLPDSLLRSIDGNPGNLEISRENIEDLIPDILSQILNNLEYLEERKDEFLNKIKQLAAV